MIDTRTATAWATTCRAALATTYPYAAGHVTRGPDDVCIDPVGLHPAFHGSLDWHSSCHMQWSLLRLRPLLDEAERRATDQVLRARLTPEAIACEVEYLHQHPGFERPYGWAWALMLASEARGTEFEDALAPLAHAVTESFTRWLPHLPFPVRHGVHTNTAFALTLALRAGADELAKLVAQRAVELFGADRQAAWEHEPSGNDFLSPALSEAVLLAAVLDDPKPWLTGFLRGLADAPVLETPPAVDDSDGHLAHLNGLALSRAWQLRTLAPYLDDATRARALAAAHDQVASVNRAITCGDFMSTHWLVSFALLADEALGR